MNRIILSFIVISLFTLTCCLQRQTEQPQPTNESALTNGSPLAKVGDIPCNPPTNLVVTDIPSPLPNHNLTFSWTASATASLYDIRVTRLIAGTPVTVFNDKTSATSITSSGNPFWIGVDYRVSIVSECGENYRSVPLSGDVLLTGGGAVTVIADNLDATDAPASKTGVKPASVSNIRIANTVSLTAIDPIPTSPNMFKSFVFQAGASCGNRLCFGDGITPSITVTTGDWVAYIPVTNTNGVYTSTFGGIPTRKWRIIKVVGQPGETSGIYEFPNGLLTKDVIYKVKVYSGTNPITAFGNILSQSIPPVVPCYSH